MNAATSRTRQPAGISTGGQFAPESRGRATVSLDPDGAEQATTTTPKFGEIDRDKRIEAMRAEIDTAMDSLSSAEGWATFLEQSAKFHRYSLSNRLLIMIQNPDATRVAGFNDWKNKHGRTVKKGEKALWVMAPVTRKEKRVNEATGEENEISHFVGARPVGVFDISQTEAIEGDPRAYAVENPAIERRLLEGDAPEGMTEDLTRAAASFGYQVDFVEDTGGARAGYTDFRAKRIVVRATDSPREQANTLAHELGHVACGHGEKMDEYHTGAGGQRPDMEVEAESVAYTLSRFYGIEEAGQSNFGYIDGWARGDKDKVKATATTVVAATKSVLDVIEHKGQEKAA